MRLRFASLGSGSRGNAVLVEFGATLLMVDCGLTLKAIERRLRALDRRPIDVTAVLVTHEHSDHIRGVARFAHRYGIPVWMTAGTAASSAARNLIRGHVLSCHRPLEIGSIDVQPFPVPHDAREPAQFVFKAGHRKLGILTDTGHVTSHIRDKLARCDAIAIECNHDLESLRCGPYPQAVKARVASPLGHLNNDQAAELLDEVGHPGLQWVTALHISETNNSPDLVRRSLSGRGGHIERALHIATQDEASEWIDIE